MFPNHKTSLAHRRRGPAAVVAGAVTAALMLAVAPLAAADSDPVNTGSVTLDLSNLPAGVSTTPFHSKKLGKDEYKLEVFDGKFDPTTGVGTLESFDGVTFGFQGNHAKTGAYEVGFGSGAKVKNRVVGKPTAFAKVKGGRLSRDGFGAAVTKAKLILTDKGAANLNKALGKRNGGPFEAGQIGTVGGDYTPFTVQIASGGLGLSLDPVVAGKLTQKGVNPANGAFSVVAPATLASTSVSFPLTGGRLPLDRGDFGAVTGSGGLKLTKTNAVGGGCETAHPLGTNLTYTNPGAAFNSASALTADTAASSGGSSPGASVASLGALTIASNPATRQLTVTAPATLSSGGAATLNTVFGTASGGCGTSDFAVNDPLGTVTITAIAH